MTGPVAPRDAMTPLLELARALRGALPQVSVEWGRPAEGNLTCDPRADVLTLRAGERFLAWCWDAAGRRYLVADLDEASMARAEVEEDEADGWPGASSVEGAVALARELLLSPEVDLHAPPPGTDPFLRAVAEGLPRAAQGLELDVRWTEEASADPRGRVVLVVGAPHPENRAWVRCWFDASPGRWAIGVSNRGAPSGTSGDPAELTALLVRHLRHLATRA